jgi:hypothetical protein
MTEIRRCIFQKPRSTRERQGEYVDRRKKKKENDESKKIKRQNLKRRKKVSEYVQKRTTEK